MTGDGGAERCPSRGLREGKRRITLEKIQIRRGPAPSTPRAGQPAHPARRWRHEAVVGAPWRLLRAFRGAGAGARGVRAPLPCVLAALGPACPSPWLSIQRSAETPARIWGLRGVTPEGSGRGPGPHGHAGMRSRPSSARTTSSSPPVPRPRSGHPRRALAMNAAETRPGTRGPSSARLRGCARGSRRL